MATGEKDLGDGDIGARAAIGTSSRAVRTI